MRLMFADFSHKKILSTLKEYFIKILNGVETLRKDLRTEEGKIEEMERRRRRRRRRKRRRREKE